ncbi:hypothetical protein GGP62_002189 [Salinibacter ruber]|uniref:GIY-YIG nuclease family protein n=1 Tax=Salinibacter ruber TaxID=146919 RepID=UPI0021688366|nr:GIY-YIG nuclease family protein [Salinibacter ruber]MCS3707202.1 hypothetical protein [Salinibacter ruber]
MVTTTEDPRITKIRQSKVYALYHGELIYIGSTKLPLQRRLNLHINAARVEQKWFPVSEHIREEVDDPREELEIRELDYDSEDEALDELGDSTLNVRRGNGGVSEDDLYDWSPWELDILEKRGPSKASDILDASYTDCRTAARKLGVCETRSSHLSDTAVQEVWVQYYRDTDQTYGEVAQKVSADVNAQQVGGIVREDNYEHVPKPSSDACEKGVVREEPAVGTKRVRAR